MIQSNVNALEVVARLAHDNGRPFPARPKVIFIQKPSLIRYRCWKEGREWNGSRLKARNWLKNTVPKFDRAWASHLRQAQCASRLKRLFEGAEELQAVSLFDLVPSTLEKLKSADVVVVASGDEFLKTVVRYVGPQTIVIPVNSDPLTSEGALLNRLSSLEAALVGNPNKLRLQSWTRLAVWSGSQLRGTAIDSVLFAQRLRRNPSQIFISGHPKLPAGTLVLSSGVLLSTGSGSTGWIQCAVGRPRGEAALLSSLAAGQLGVVVAEPFRGDLSGYTFLSDGVSQGGWIRLRSLTFPHAELIVDGQKVLKVPPGSSVMLRHGAQGVMIEIRSADEILLENHEAFESVFFAASLRDSITRYRLTVVNEGRVLVDEEQKSAGVRVCTSSAVGEVVAIAAAGEARQGLHQMGVAAFSRESARFDVAVMEPRSISGSEIHGSLIGLQSAVTLWSPQPDSCVQLDAYHEVPVAIGERISVRLADQPLSVVWVAER